MVLIIKKKNFQEKIWVYIIPFVFAAIFVLNIIGALYFYDATKDDRTFRCVLVGSSAFILGILFGSIAFKNINKKRVFLPTIEEIRSNHRLQKNAVQCALFLFLFSFLLSSSLFIQKGIPLFSANDNQMRSTFGVGTWGRIRALVTWCPMSCLMIYCISLINKKYKILALTTCTITFVLLAFYSFKGNLVWFALMLYLVNSAMKKKIELGKGLLYAGLAEIVILIIFSVWLSEDYSFAFEHIVKRITCDQVDGFNFIVMKYIPSEGYQNGKHFVSEMVGTLFNVYKESFDIVLARLFYGRNVTWGIVQTFYGFLYIDFGMLGIFIGFFVVGVIISNILRSLLFSDKLTITALCLNIYLVYFLIKIVLVGNVFNEIKGLLLSALVFNLLFLVLYAFCYRRGKILNRKKSMRNS